MDQSSKYPEPFLQADDNVQKIVNSRRTQKKRKGLASARCITIGIILHMRKPTTMGLGSETLRYPT